VIWILSESTHVVSIFFSFPFNLMFSFYPSVFPSFFTLTLCNCVTNQPYHRK
jgi:hypothetical protein